ncbi:YqhA family protein [Modicisalibacter tunisiensis]|uniref:YqhA family protein n=1 Tax=Modicisalibacter TaxID=574347 RepID=UPI0013D668E1|nr:MULTISPECIES: YqhA family protein [Modicisalibacter]MBZ9539985.1 YqhA family protein [Modicisalibacter tunisiensis]
MIERWLRRSRLMIHVTVVLAMLAAFVLYALACLSLLQTLWALVTGGAGDGDTLKESAVGLLKMMDLLLIAASFQIMAHGMYRLFLRPDFESPGPLQVASFTELKHSLVTVAGIVLVILFVENAVKLGAGRPILELGIAIALVIAASGWAFRSSKGADKGH